MCKSVCPGIFSISSALLHTFILLSARFCVRRIFSGQKNALRISMFVRVVCASSEEIGTLHWIRLRVNSVKNPENLSELNGKRSKVANIKPDFYCLLRGKVKFKRIRFCFSTHHRNPMKNKRRTNNKAREEKKTHTQTLNDADIRNQIEFEPYNFIDIDICCLSECIFSSSLLLFLRLLTLYWNLRARVCRSLEISSKRVLQATLGYFFVHCRMGCFVPADSDFSTKERAGTSESREGFFFASATNYDHNRIFVQVYRKCFL